MLHGVEAAERRHQHEQGRARQMEIRHQHVDRAEAIAGRDEDRRLVGERRNAAVLGRGTLQQPQRRGANSHDAAADSARRIERIGGRGTNPAPLGMHAMRIGILDLDRQKSAGADVQCHRVQRDAARRKTRLQILGEMQACGRGRDGAFGRGEHGLVVGGIAIVGRPLGGDIGRQRRRAEVGDGLVERRPMESERQCDLAGIALVLDRGIEIAEQAHPPLVAEPDDIALLQFLGGLDQRLPARTVQALDQGGVDPRLGLAADATAAELCGDHLGVVDHELVARTQAVGQIASDTIREPAIGADHQHARGIARACGPQRDVVNREIEIEQIGAHDA